MHEGPRDTRAAQSTESGLSQNGISMAPNLFGTILAQTRALSTPAVSVREKSGKAGRHRSIHTKSGQAAPEKAGINWRGWYAFRRGLATNLYELGVNAEVIQAILRHNEVSANKGSLYQARRGWSASRAALATLQDSLYDKRAVEEGRVEQDMVVQ